MKSSIYVFIVFVLFLIIALSFFTCQKSTGQKLSLYFREDWKEIPAETPVTQEHVNNPELTMYRHGPSQEKIKKSHHDKPADDPYYIWSGECEDLWALTLEKRNSVADFSSGGIVRWRTRQAGNRILRIVLGLDDGSYLVSDQGTGPTKEWTVTDISFDTLKWRSLEFPCMSAGSIVQNPSLNNVKRVGFTDLMAGKGSPECSRLDWIEVYVK